jgi:hypothetical protein
MAHHFTLPYGAEEFSPRPGLAVRLGRSGNDAADGTAAAVHFTLQKLKGEMWHGADRDGVT